MKKISDSFTTCKVLVDLLQWFQSPWGASNALWYLRPSISTVGEGVDEPGAESHDKAGAAASGRIAERFDGGC